MRYFILVCQKCNKKAQKTKVYKGIVNMDIRPIFFGQAIIKFNCFTCGMVEITKLGITPKDLEEFKKMVNKQNGIIEV